MTDHVAPTAEWLPGPYTISLEVTDGYTDETAKQTGTFTVVE
ncbi:hypothetical protein [Halorhabdus amylolytica]|nr:hypothetical protein [Halorhabdus amylolytica]